ncbi:MAG: carboxypeptidase-like regulatory domain-containing protein [Planctomycetota bacterium]
MRNGLLIFAALAVVGVVAVLLWRGSGERQSPMGESKEAQPVAGGSVAGEERHVETPQPVAEQDGAKEGRSAIEIPAVPESGRDVSLRVVDGVTGEGVPHAEVWIAGRDALRAARNSMPVSLSRDGDPLPLLAAISKARRTDSAGVLPVHEAEVGPGTLIAAIEAGDAQSGPRRSGWMSIRQPIAKDSDLVLALDPPTELRVRVVDAAGTPYAEVPLSVVMPQNSAARSLWSGSSAADGIATIPSLRQRARMIAGGGPIDGIVLKARLEVPFVPIPAPAEFTLGALPKQPIDLVLPPHGSIRVQLDANPSAGPLTASFVMNVIAPLAPGETPQNPPSLTTVEGACRFPVVGLGLKLRIDVRRGGAADAQQIECMGPVAEGQEVVVRVPLPEGNAVVARLVDVKREPLRKTMVGLDVAASREGSSSSSGQGLTTDGEGRVRIPIEDGLGPLATRTISFSHRATGRDARVILPKPLPSGTIDLGDVVLDEPLPLIAGRVCNAKDEAVAGAEVSVENEDNARARSDAKGAFTIRSRVTPNELRLRVSAKGFIDGRFGPFAVGARDVVLRLEQGGSISGKALVDELGVPVDLRVVLTQAGIESRYPEERDLRDLGFSFDSLAPGTYAVELHVAGRVQPLAVQEGVAVRSGERSELPPFDLRGRLRAVRFDVVDADGGAVSEAKALVLDETESDRHEGVLVRSGHGCVVTDRAQVDLFVFAEGRCATKVVALRDGERITLAPSPKIVVSLAAGLHAPQGCQIAVQCRSADASFSNGRYSFRAAGSSQSTTGGRPWDSFENITVADSGSTEIPVVLPGPYEMSWLLRQSGGNRFVVLPGATPARVEVTPGRATVDCVLGFDMAAADAAAAGLR